MGEATCRYCGVTGDADAKDINPRGYHYEKRVCVDVLMEERDRLRSALAGIAQPSEYREAVANLRDAVKAGMPTIEKASRFESIDLHELKRLIAGINVALAALERVEGEES